jgi:hypothetical protein
MSRTYRAKRGDQYGARPWGWDEYGYPNWQRNDATIATFFHSDCHYRDGSLGQTLKYHTDSKRRADAREQLHRVSRDPEAVEYVCREREYRGIVWHYD